MYNHVSKIELDSKKKRDIVFELLDTFNKFKIIKANIWTYSNRGIFGIEVYYEK